MVPRHEERAQKSRLAHPKQFGKNTLVALVVMAAAALVLWGFDSLAKAAVEALITLV